MKTVRKFTSDRLAKRARISSPIETTLFSRLPNEIVAKIRGYISSEPWRLTFDVALWNEGSKEKLNDYIWEIVAAGTKATQYFHQSGLIRGEWISRLACYHGNHELWKWGIEIVPNVARYKSHLEFASAGGRVEMLKVLLNRWKNPDLEHIIKIAVYAGQNHVVRFIMGKIAPSTKFIESTIEWVCACGRLDIYRDVLNTYHCRMKLSHVDALLEDAKVESCIPELAMRGEEIQRRKSVFFQYLLTQRPVLRRLDWISRTDSIDSIVVLINNGFPVRIENILRWLMIPIRDESFWLITIKRFQLQEDVRKEILKMALNENLCQLVEHLRSSETPWVRTDVPSYGPRRNELIKYCVANDYPWIDLWFQQLLQEFPSDAIKIVADARPDLIISPSYIYRILANQWMSKKSWLVYLKSRQTIPEGFIIVALYYGQSEILQHMTDITITENLKKCTKQVLVAAKLLPIQYDPQPAIEMLKDFKSDSDQLDAFVQEALRYWTSLNTLQIQHSLVPKEGYHERRIWNPTKGLQARSTLYMPDY